MSPESTGLQQPCRQPSAQGGRQSHPLGFIKVKSPYGINIKLLLVHSYKKMERYKQ